jgi:hypothetical protein
MAPAISTTWVGHLIIPPDLPILHPKPHPLEWAWGPLKYPTRFTNIAPKISTTWVGHFNTWPDSPILHQKFQPLEWATWYSAFQNYAELCQAIFIAPQSATVPCDTKAEVSMTSMRSQVQFQPTTLFTITDKACLCHHKNIFEWEYMLRWQNEVLHKY